MHTLEMKHEIFDPETGEIFEPFHEHSPAIPVQLNTQERAVRAFTTDKNEIQNIKKELKISSSDVSTILRPPFLLSNVPNFTTTYGDGEERATAKPLKPYKLRFGLNKNGDSYATLLPTGTPAESQTPPRSEARKIKQMSWKMQKRIQHRASVIDAAQTIRYNPKFITLTLPVEMEMEQIVKAFDIWMKAIKRKYIEQRILDYEGKRPTQTGQNKFRKQNPAIYKEFSYDFYYIWVKEIQPQRFKRTGQKIWHYHICLNIQFLPYELVNSTWLRAVETALLSQRPLTKAANSWQPKAPFSKRYIRTEVRKVKKSVGGYMAKYLKKGGEIEPEGRTGNLTGCSQSMNAQLKYYCNDYQVYENSENITNSFARASYKTRKKLGKFTKITNNEYCTRIDSRSSKLKAFILADLQRKGIKIERFNIPEEMDRRKEERGAIDYAQIQKEKRQKREQLSRQFAAEQAKYQAQEIEMEIAEIEREKMELPEFDYEQFDLIF